MAPVEAYSHYQEYVSAVTLCEQKKSVLEESILNFFTNNDLTGTLSVRTISNIISIFDQTKALHGAISIALKNKPTADNTPFSTGRLAGYSSLFERLEYIDTTLQTSFDSFVRDLKDVEKIDREDPLWKEYESIFRFVVGEKWQGTSSGSHHIE